MSIGTGTECDFSRLVIVVLSFACYDGVYPSRFSGVGMTCLRLYPLAIASGELFRRSIPSRKDQEIESYANT